MIQQQCVTARLLVYFSLAPLVFQTSPAVPRLNYICSYFTIQFNNNIQTTHDNSQCSRGSELPGSLVHFSTLVFRALISCTEFWNDQSSLQVKIWTAVSDLASLLREHWREFCEIVTRTRDKWRFLGVKQARKHAELRGELAKFSEITRTVPPGEISAFER